MMRRLAITLMIAFVLLSGCSAPQKAVVDVNKSEEGLTAKYEVMEDDIFSLWEEENFTSYNVSVRGVMLNDTQRDVIDQLGSPDNFTRFEGDGLIIENLEYGEQWGLNQSGLIVHLENDRVTKITLKEEFNEFLKGDTVINDSKRDLYFSIGTPAGKSLLFKFILLHYSEKGLDVITFRGDEVGFSLVSPGEFDRNISTNVTEQYYIPYADEVRLT